MMRRGRRRGSPVLRTVATTAVVAGTAGAVHHHQEEKYDKKAAAKQAEGQAQYDAMQQQAQYEAEQQQAMQPQYAPAAPAAAAEPDYMAELQQLAALNKSGVLTDEEFAAKKAQLLGL